MGQNFATIFRKVFAFEMHKILELGQFYNYIIITHFSTIKCIFFSSTTVSHSRTCYFEVNIFRNFRILEINVVHQKEERGDISDGKRRLRVWCVVLCLQKDLTQNRGSFWTVGSTPRDWGTETLSVGDGTMRIKGIKLAPVPDRCRQHRRQNYSN